MELLEMKRKVLRLIEEVSDSKEKLTDDPDIETKLNDVINQIMFELARFKKIPARAKVKTELTEGYDLDTLPSFYQLYSVKARNKNGEAIEIRLFGHYIESEEPGEIELKINYYKYPERITDTTSDTYKFELSDDALEIMPYGVAADLLKSDVSNQFGKVYAERYESMLSRLDSRTSPGMVYIEGEEGCQAVI